MPRAFLDYLEDIHDAIAESQQFVTGMTFEQFAADEKTAYAVVRTLEIIGEAARKIPEHTKCRIGGKVRRVILECGIAVQSPTRRVGQRCGCPKLRTAFLPPDCVDLPGTLR